MEIPVCENSPARCTMPHTIKLLNLLWLYVYHPRLYAIRRGEQSDIIDEFCSVCRSHFPYQKVQDTSQNYFITINFKPQTEITHVQNRMLKIILKKWITKYYYVYEQRGTDLETVGSGLHVHLLVCDSPKSKSSEVVREIYSSVKSMVGSKSSVDVRKIPFEWVYDKLKYLSGEKWDVEKLPKVQMDKIFRQKYSLLDIYTNQNDIQEDVYQEKNFQPISPQELAEACCEN